MALYMLAALWFPIQDCDETFNYWEPLHFLAHGSGFQTWEYSPVYALRTYTFLMPFLALVRGFQLLGLSRAAQFTALRIAMGTANAAAAAVLIDTSGAAFGKYVQRSLWILLALSPGMMSASISLLPQQTSMFIMMLILASWIRLRFRLVIVLMGIMVLVVWPFTAILALPPGIHALIAIGLVTTFLYSILTVLVLVCLTIVIDFQYYRKVVVPIYNIIAFNWVRTDGTGGADVFGVEGPLFYLKNLALQWNVSLLPVLGFPLLLLLHMLLSNLGLPYYRSKVTLVSGLALWIAVFQAMDHKEERFFYVVYPVFALTASFSIDFVLRWAALPRAWKRLPSRIVALFFSCFVVFSLFRSATLVSSYHAPQALFRDPIWNTLSPGTVCMGDEWFRFPSSFLLPSHMHLEFIASSFEGQLPAHFKSTSVPPLHMNARNKRQKQRLVPVAQCNYLIALDSNTLEHIRVSSFNTSLLPVVEYPLINPKASPMYARSFLFPLNRFTSLILYRLVSSEPQ